MPDETHPDEEGRHDMPTTAAGEEEDVVVVQVSTRITRGMRKRLRMAAAQSDTSVQEMQRIAFEEFLRARGL